jgi:hypothetical protein
MKTPLENRNTNLQYLLEHQECPRYEKPSFYMSAYLVDAILSSIQFPFWVELGPISTSYTYLLFIALGHKLQKIYL